MNWLIIFFDSEESNNKSVFTTKDQTKKMSDKYFIESGDKIRFFYETAALGEDGNLRVPKHHSINKIGHALHEKDEIFREFSKQSKLEQLSHELGMKIPVISQSMVIFKNPKIGAEVNVHQDSTFMNTKPLSCVALWFALDDVLESNGNLMAVPGSHKEGIVQRFKREGNEKVFFSPPDPDEASPWDFSKFDRQKYPEKWKKLLPCPKGSVVCIHGSVVHCSDENKSDLSRNVYTFHMVDQSAKWSQDNWLQTEKPFKTFKEL